MKTVLDSMFDDVALDPSNGSTPFFFVTSMT
jgi:hypothetical protein